MPTSHRAMTPRAPARDGWYERWEVQHGTGRAVENGIFMGYYSDLMAFYSDFNGIFMGYTLW